MAEFCKDCYIKYGIGTRSDVRIIVSKRPDLCEGCGLTLPVVTRVKPLGLFARIFNALRSK